MSGFSIGIATTCRISIAKPILLMKRICPGTSGHKSRLRTESCPNFVSEEACWAPTEARVTELLIMALQNLVIVGSGITLTHARYQAITRTFVDLLKIGQLKWINSRCRFQYGVILLKSQSVKYTLHTEDAQTTSEWSRRLLPIKVCLILEVWLYIVSHQSTTSGPFNR